MGVEGFEPTQPNGARFTVLSSSPTLQHSLDSGGGIRTLDLTIMSRALSPTELPCRLQISRGVF